MESNKQKVLGFLKRILKKYPGLIIVSILLVVVLIILFNYDPKLEGMSLAKFNKIQAGMTYDEVVEITGEKGSVYSTYDEGTGNNDAVRVYVWYSGDGLSSAYVTFKGDIVRAKKQMGLK